MAFFIAAGTISNDIVRKETRNGVLATFRLETGAPRNGKLWIDIETWGHLAGTIAHHARKGREVSASGRVTQKTWRDKTTGEARHRYVITATDVDLLSEPAASPVVVPNAVILTGRVETILPTRSVKSGSVVCFRVSTGRSGNKAGRLELEVEHWTPPQSTPIGLAESIQVTVAGGLAYRGSSTSEHVGQTQIDARSVTVAR